MKIYQTNRNISSINKEFKLIENHFTNYSNTPKSRLITIKSDLYIGKRLSFKGKNKLILDKTCIKNPLDQIGDDDLIFNNDKLITNIKIDNFDQLSLKYSLDDEETIDNDKSEDIPIRRSKKKKKFNSSTWYKTQNKN